jgi:hypothetical protein
MRFRDMDYKARHGRTTEGMSEQSLDISVKW